MAWIIRFSARALIERAGIDRSGLIKERHESLNGKMPNVAQRQNRQESESYCFLWRLDQALVFWFRYLWS
jgi:hypothetical protein